MKLLLAMLLALPILKSYSADADVSGQVTGYNIRNNDNIFNFALALPVLTKKQMLNFNLDMFLSPETDTVTALGQSFEVPSNLSIPEQRERYIFSIRFNKPSYRLPWSQTSDLFGVGALEGQFPFRQVIDKVRGGSPLFTLINDFTFTSFSLKEIRQPVENLVVGETPHSHIMRLNGLTSENSPFMTLGVALDSEDGDFYFPIDLKLLSLSDSPPLRVTLNSHAMLAIVPKDIFAPVTLRDQSLEFPFSIIWRAKRENKALPILTDLIEITSAGLSVNSNAVSKDHTVVGYKVSLFDVSDNIIFEDLRLGSVPNRVNIPGNINYRKIRLDVYASDSKTTLKDEDDLVEITDYLSRYEKNLF
jgi:hypothetical protein